MLLIVVVSTINLLPTVAICQNLGSLSAESSFQQEMMREGTENFKQIFRYKADLVNFLVFIGDYFLKEKDYSTSAYSGHSSPPIPASCPQQFR